MKELEIAAEHREKFAEDGFIVFENFLDTDEVDRLESRFEPLFSGQWETGLAPMKSTGNTVGTKRTGHASSAIPGRRITRSQAWFSSRPSAASPRSFRVGTGPVFTSTMSSGNRRGASALSMHQDGSYNHYMVPNAMTSLWMAVTDTTADAGTVLYVRGSHKWGEAPKPETFIVEDHLEPMLQAARHAGVDAPDVVAIEVPPGGLAVHSTWIWHGSARNAADVPRQSWSRIAPPPTPAFTRPTRRMSTPATDGTPTPRWTRASSRYSGPGTATGRRG